MNEPVKIKVQRRFHNMKSTRCKKIAVVLKDFINDPRGISMRDLLSQAGLPNGYNIEIFIEKLKNELDIEIKFLEEHREIRIVCLDPQRSHYERAKKIVDEKERKIAEKKRLLSTSDRCTAADILRKKQDV